MQFADVKNDIAFRKIFGNAKSLLQTSLPDEEIAKHTGLTIEQVEQLRNEKQ
jgi:hypothetical protein